MFYLHLLFVVSVLYWFSALTAEVLLLSPAERKLHTVLRIGLGFIVSLVWFSAAFKVVSITSAWIIGLILLSCYAYSQVKDDRRRVLNQLSASFTSYLVYYPYFLIAANLFLLPLHFGGTYGPFSEGSGDVTIYADVTKYIVDRGQPAFGFDDAVFDLEQFLKRPVERSYDNVESMSHFDGHLGNPPEANYQEYRNYLMKKWPSGWFVPTAQWSFLAMRTNYSVYFAVLSFLYAYVLLGCWQLFLRFGIGVAFLAAMMVFSSHALVSTLYNHYYLQSVSLMVTTVLLGLLSSDVPIFSKAGVRTYGFCVAVVAANYLYFVSIFVSLLLLPVAVFLKNSYKARHRADIHDASSPHATSSVMETHRSKVFSMRNAVVVVFFVVTMFWLVVDIGGNLGIYSGFINKLLGLHTTEAPAVQDPKQLAALGMSIGVFTYEWLVFFFGSLSQQHLEPLIHVPAIVTYILPVSVVAGCLATMMSFGLMLTTLFRMIFKREERSLEDGAIGRFAAIYVVCCGAIVFHQLLAQAFLYTQAKASQNVLIVLFCALLIPLAITRVYRNNGRAGRWLKAAGVMYTTVIIIFIASLFSLRLVYAEMLGAGAGRSAALDDAFYREVTHIRSADSSAFVLVEPRSSADTYLDIQAFTGMKMLPTRYLALSEVYSEYDKGKWLTLRAKFNVLGSDFMTAEDMDHVWTIQARKISTHNVLAGISSSDYKWVSEKLSESTEPRLLCFGHDYEPFFGERARSTQNGDNGWFTFFRNGSSVLVLPGHAEPKRIEVTLEPRDSVNFAPMVREVRLWSDTARSVGQWLKRLDTTGGFITMRYEIPSTNTVQLVSLVRYWGEFWLNVRIDGAELHPPEDTPALRQMAKVDLKGEVEAFPEVVKAGSPVIAEWKGVDPANEDDWVGVFPVGGEDASRIAFTFTGGDKEGSVQLMVPPNVRPGTYEVRLYSRGGWQKIAVSTMFRIVP